MAGSQNTFSSRISATAAETPNLGRKGDTVQQVGETIFISALIL
jgi:hypothetical protein